MATTKTNTKPTSTVRKTSRTGAVAPANAELAAPSEASTVTMDKKELAQFRATYRQVAKRFGVQVTDIPNPSHNPYKMSRQDTLEIARAAGLIRRSNKPAKPNNK